MKPNQTKTIISLNKLFFTKLQNSKISFFIIGDGMSLKKDYLIMRIKNISKKRKKKNEKEKLKYNAWNFNSYPW